MKETLALPNNAPFTIVTRAQPNATHTGQNTHLLASIGFAAKAAVLDSTRPVFNIGLPLLNEAPYCEQWISPTPVHYGQYASISYSDNGEVLFGHLLLEEADFPDFRIASATAYQHIFELLQQRGYPYLLRMWNYFPAITMQQGELNRYQTFCLGRQEALDAHGNFAYSPPAATAIGTQQAGLQLYFLAAQTAGMQLENPRQTSAFLYPRQYGPVSPAFSRATVKNWRGNIHLYISGTTSIVGHETLHIGNPLAQLQETLHNLNALLAHGADTLDVPIRHLHQLSQLKVYVHDPSTLPILQQALNQHLAGSAIPVLYLQGDVCRPDLMVEMEGIYA